MTKIVKFSLQWKRPLTVPFPRVWRRFEAKSLTGKLHKLRIQDLTPDRHEEAWKLCLKNFWAEEPVAKTLKMAEDTDLMAHVRNIYREIMQQNVSLMAVLDEPDEKEQMVGLSILAAFSRADDTLKHLDGEKAQKFGRLQEALRKDVNVFDRLDTDVYLEDCGSSVEPEFRGRHLAYNMISCIEDVARILGIGGKTVTLSNLKLSQMAHQEGLEVYREIFYDDFRDENGDIIVPVREFKSIRYCGRKFL